MIAPLLQEINRVSDHAYDNFRLKSMRYICNGDVCELFYHYRLKEGQNYREIESLSKMVLPAGATYRFHYARVTDEPQDIVLAVRNILDEKRKITIASDAVQVDGDNLTIVLDEVDCNRCIDTDFAAELADELDTEFCKTFEIELKAVKDERDAADIAAGLFEQIRESAAPVASGVNRVIQPFHVEKYIGDIVTGEAQYIMDVRPDPETKIALCGTLSNPSMQTRTSAKSGKDFTVFRATLTDFTEDIRCFAFVSESSKSKYENLDLATPVFMTGTVQPGFKDGPPEFRIQQISYCELPSDFKEQVFKKPVPNKYTLLVPQPYVEVSQPSFFDAPSIAPDPYFIGKKFVVFDTETTGVNRKTDRIIEIACVKMIDGEITEYLETFVNPMMHIPEGASKVNHITDDMVEDAPEWADVVGDIYKFCEGCALVGYNVSFDVGMLNNTARETHYFFENSTVDVMEIAHKKVRGARDYTLSTLLKIYNLNNENAHRALADTVATAKLFKTLIAEKA